MQQKKSQINRQPDLVQDTENMFTIHQAICNIQLAVIVFQGISCNFFETWYF